MPVATSFMERAMSRLKIKKLAPAQVSGHKSADAARSSLNRFQMAAVPGGAFLMGSDRHYPEEAPARRVLVDSFWIDETPVTNADFAQFVAETHYVTFAERAPSAADYPNADPALLKAGSAVFQKADQPVPLLDPSQWWAFVVGASWNRPLGPDSSIKGLEDHPVVHIVYEDAAAFARWAGKRLPTEWEFAARGGLADADFAWGSELEPEGVAQANYWHGEFPWRELKGRPGVRTTPVKTFAANPYGLYDLIGNVWEITEDWFTATPRPPSSPCCVAKNPRGTGHSDNPEQLGGRKVMKGGSHLCAPNYCQRYRPAARYPHSMDTSTTHIGFRCVVNRP
jgi:sulfatase modifying factor 1